MSDPIDGTYTLVTVAALALLLLAWTYAAWANRVEQRRRERLVQRNLWRISGGRGL